MTITVKSQKAIQKTLLVITTLAVFASCNHSGNSHDPKAQLDSLKGVQEKISEQIKTLEAQIAAKDTTAIKEKPKLVSVLPVQQGVFQHFVEVQGRVDAEQNVNVSSQIPGTVTSILVVNGQSVRKGQVLATMNAAAAQAQIDALKKNWELANLLYEKQKSLWDQNIGTEVQYLQAKNQKESLEKNLATLNEQYEMTKIKSPIDGTVDQVFAKIGQSAAPGYPTFRVVNLSQMKVTAELAERYAGTVKLGDGVTISFPDAKKEINKKITAVSQVIDASSRSFTVDVKLSDKDKEFFHPNMIALLKICDYTNQQAIAIPVNTVQSTEEGKFVYLASEQNGKTIAKKQEITSGLFYGDQVEIMSGLKAGDKIITVGYQDLSDGQPVLIESQVASK